MSNLSAAPTVEASLDLNEVEQAIATLRREHRNGDPARRPRGDALRGNGRGPRRTNRNRPLPPIARPHQAAQLMGIGETAATPSPKWRDQGPLRQGRMADGGDSAPVREPLNESEGGGSGRQERRRTGVFCPTSCA
jgi:hypothetical protein